MSGITRYILLQLAGPFVFVTLALTGVVWLTQSLRFLDLIINKGLSAGGFLYLTLLLLPGFLTIILPIAAFCTILYVYHRLDNDSEIIVMRAAGLSQRRLFLPALILSVAVAATTFVMTLYLMPLGFRTFKDLQFVVRHNYASVLIQAGTFNTLVDGVTVYVRERRSSGELLGILVHDSRDRQRPVTMMAERGALTLTDDGPRFIMINGNRQEVESDRGQLSLLYFERYALDLGGLAQSPATRWREASERYLNELFEPGDSPDDIRSTDEFLAEAHRRLVSPLYALALGLIAVTAVLAGAFNRRGNVWRVFIGAGAAVAFELTGLGILPLVQATPALAPLMYLHVLAVMALCYFVLVRPPRLTGTAAPVGAA